MRSLFETIIIIVLFTVLFLFYYLLKAVLKYSREKKEIKQYQEKKKQEKRAQKYNELHNILVDLKMNRAFWVEIYVHGKSDNRFRIERRPVLESWLFLLPCKNIPPDILNHLERYGTTIYSGNNEFAGIECANPDKLLHCTFYVLDKITEKDQNAEIIFKC